MTRSDASYWRFVLLVLLAVVPGCDSLPLLAPSDSTITVLASASVVPLDGETTIIAVVTEPSGTPVQNGTLVTFSSTLGTLSPQESPTQDGQASVRLLAGRVAGTAMVSAFSGTATSNTVEVSVGTVAP